MCELGICELGRMGVWKNEGRGLAGFKGERRLERAEVGKRELGLGGGSEVVVRRRGH
jgi:hypothetical protein